MMTSTSCPTIPLALPLRTFILLGAFCLLLFCTPAYAESPTTAAIISAIEQENLPRLRLLLEQTGVAPQDLTDAMGTEKDVAENLLEAKATLLFQQEQQLIMELGNVYGYGIWVFLATSPTNPMGPLRCLSSENFGRYPTMMLDPVKLDQGGFLVSLYAQQAHGTGATLNNALWFHFSPTELRPLLVQPIGGYVMGWGMPFSREFDANPTLPQGCSSFCDITTTYTATYTQDDFAGDKEPVLLLETNGTTTHAYNPKTQTYELVPARSTLTAAQIDGLFNDAEDQFLANNLMHLKKLATDGNAQQQEWLRGFVAKCTEGQAKQELLKVMK